ncbi:hypothetical protein ACVR05_02160 [Streptococcus caprae]|uniref:Uncharacterized protein n=1 Tax=Streptococcus caprae TaxID=1640501 RepID=A0ABV8CWM9_9STRE
MEEKKINLEGYLQARNERKVAIISSIIFFIIYAIAAFVLAFKMARYFTFLSVGNITIVAITVLVLLPPITLVHQVEKQCPEWKQESSKKVSLSQNFITKTLLIFLGFGLVLAFLFTQALSAVHEPAKTSIYHIPNDTTTTISELPSLKKE